MTLRKKLFEAPPLGGFKKPMICECGEKYNEVYHRDFSELCPECAKKQIGEDIRVFRDWYAQLTIEQRNDYFANGPYTRKQVKDIIFR